MALDALGLMQPMVFTIDVKSGLIQQPVRPQLMKGDRRANRIIVRMMDGGEALDLTGAAVTGSFISPLDGAEIPLTGSVSGNEASVILKDACYAETGHYECNVKLTYGDTERTVLSITGHVLSKGSGAVIDVDNVIPSLDSLLAQIEAMKTATQAAIQAADRVEQMQIDASGLAGDSNKLGGKSPEYYIQPFNWADNGNFANPVNQWNETTYTGAMYTIDRWLSGTSVTQVDIVAGSDNHKALKLTHTGDASIASISQRFSMTNPRLYGKKMTAAICLDDGTIYTVAVTITSSASKSVEIPGGILQLHVPEGNVLAMRIYINVGYSLTMKWAALYEGTYTADTLPPYVPKGYAAELAACQRYYRKCDSVYVVADSNGYYAINFEAPMRIAPTMTVANMSTGEAVEVVYTSKQGFMLKGLSTGARISVWYAADASL